MPKIWATSIFLNYPKRKFAQSGHPSYEEVPHVIIYFFLRNYFEDHIFGLWYVSLVSGFLIDFKIGI
jgi:hypothetical protein